MQLLANSVLPCEIPLYKGIKIEALRIPCKVPIKTASETGYCDCICGCYELASLRDEDTGKGYCPACGKDHVDLNAGVGVPLPAPARVSANIPGSRKSASMPAPADPPGRLR